MNGAKKFRGPIAQFCDIFNGKTQQGGPEVVGMGSGLESEALLNLAIDQSFRHIVQRDGNCMDLEIESSQVLVTNSDALFEVPVACILTPQDLTAESEKSLLVYELMSKTSSDKRTILDGIAKCMNSKSLPQTMTDDIISVTDELFTNAIYNAPFVDLKTHANPGVDRQGMEVRLTDGREVRTFVAMDQSRLVVGCVDPYGTLDLLSYLTRIRSVYQRGAAATLNFGAGGAGLGSYIIFNAGASLFYGVWPGKQTVICCVMPLGMRSSRRLQLPKHLHWLQR